MGLAVSTAVLANGSAPVSAQMVPNIEGLESSLFSQDLTDAVTQGFRPRDRTFFEDGVIQFEAAIDALQQGDRSEPILIIEPVAQDWQQFESGPEAD